MRNEFHFQRQLGLARLRGEFPNVRVSSEAVRMNGLEQRFELFANLERKRFELAARRYPDDV